MNLQQLIYLVLLAALFTTTILYGRLKYKLRSLGDLVASSPAVCYVCRQYGVPEPVGTNWIITQHVDGLLDHEYIDSRLVYLPDEFLR